MDFDIKLISSTTSIMSLKTDCLVVGIFKKNKLSSIVKDIDKYGEITNILKSGDLNEKLGSTLLLRNIQKINAKRILLVNLGDKKKKIKESNFIKIIQSIMNVFCNIGASNLLLMLPFNKIEKYNLSCLIIRTIIIISDNLYRSDAQKSKKKPIKINIKKIIFALDEKNYIDGKNAIIYGCAISKGIELTKNLGNLSANICTPTYLENISKKLSFDYKMDIEIINREQMQRLKMGSLLSVTHGSSEPPKLIIIKYMNGKFKEAPIVLVGKGVTFDTGGISIKPSYSMDEMKYDMCGAASILGTLYAISEMNLELNIIGVIVASENMLSGNSTKPGDIVVSMSGKTIEVLDTDAEGRLILCDALTYVERFKPSVVIDIATLTGACVVALGHHNSGLFSRNDEKHTKLVLDLLRAGKMSGDTAWNMPIEDRYQKQLKSNFADISNIGNSSADSITAACFLENFTKKYVWAHLDIAGVAWKSGDKKGATGRPVALLTYYLMLKSPNINFK
ncbi:leucyl aminopeptidase [Candidatus Profftella armatura]|uniref:Probable cytosol aminopeptidase n=1 Tax=Candidatus Profftella armatura TaxID=669502 RepID=S5RM48_9PROT|nr:leucyl aminopeptidase [Candidatus Profftella armatura]AGS07026.1 leucyl aminopeptidase [Candidatus Profftella armatura]ALC96085.1 aminopeptidase [Candidatus Profftella armatura]